MYYTGGGKIEVLLKKQSSFHSVLGQGSRQLMCLWGKAPDRYCSNSLEPGKWGKSNRWEKSPGPLKMGKSTQFQQVVGSLRWPACVKSEVRLLVQLMEAQISAPPSAGSWIWLRRCPVQARETQRQGQGSMGAAFCALLYPEAPCGALGSLIPCVRGAVQEGTSWGSIGWAPEGVSPRNTSCSHLQSADGGEKMKTEEEKMKPGRSKVRKMFCELPVTSCHP